MNRSLSQCVIKLHEERHDLEDYQGGVPRWCTGCGDNAILAALDGPAPRQVLLRGSARDGFAHRFSAHDYEAFAASFGLPATERLTVKPDADWPTINPSPSSRIGPSAASRTGSVAWRVARDRKGAKPAVLLRSPGTWHPTP